MKSTTITLNYIQYQYDASNKNDIIDTLRSHGYKVQTSHISDARDIDLNTICAFKGVLKLYKLIVYQDTIEIHIGDYIYEDIKNSNVLRIMDDITFSTLINTLK